MMCTAHLSGGGGGYGRGVAHNSLRCHVRLFSENVTKCKFVDGFPTLNLILLYSSGMYFYKIVITVVLYNWTAYSQYACY